MANSKRNTSMQGPKGRGPSRATPYVKVPSGLGGKQNPGKGGSSGPAKSGGGPNVNKHVKAEHVGGSDQTRKVSVTAGAHIGRQVGDHSTTSGKPLQRNDPELYNPVRDYVPLGNEVSKNVGRGGPGTGRTVHATGAQAYYGNDANHPGTIHTDGRISPPGSNQGSSTPTRPMGAPEGGGGPAGFGFRAGGK